MQTGQNVQPLIPIDRFEIFAAGLDHPECLAFDREGNLWAGGEAGQVYRIDRSGKVEQIATLGTFNAGLAFSPAGDLIICNPASGIGACFERRLNPTVRDARRRAKTNSAELRRLRRG